MNEHKCTYIGHQKESASFLCLYHDCKEQNRTLCCICKTKSLQHQHGLLGSNHFIEIDNFIKYNESRLMQLYQQQLKQFKLLIEKVDGYLKDITKLFQIFQSKCQELKVQYKDLIKIINQQEVNQQQDNQQQVNQRKSINDIYRESINEIYKFYSIQKEELQNINLNSQQLITNANTVFEQVKDILGQNYLAQGYQQQTINIDNKELVKKEYRIEFSQLSYDQRYLVTCFYHNQLQTPQKSQKSYVKITDIILNYELSEMEFDTKITACDFSISHKNQEIRLYLGDDRGNLNILSYQNGQFYQIQNREHKSGISFIKSLDQRRLIISDIYSCLLIIDTMRDRLNEGKNIYVELQAEKVHKDLVPSLDYFEDKLVTCSHDLSIKIWKVCFDKLEQLIHKKNCHEEKIHIIRFNKDATQLLTLDLMGKLKHWQIDYKKKEIIQLHAITHIPSYNCSFVDQNCIQLIGKEKIYYFNIQKQYVSEQEFCHMYANDQKEGMFPFQTKQVESRKFIIIPQQTYVKVLGPSYAQ